jgi:hypothetical protein
MPEVHLPNLEELEEEDHEHTSPPAAHRSPWQPLLRILLEVTLISTGVFLGLAGEQWRESAHRRELAEVSLNRFRTELAANREAVARVKDYHVTTLKSLQAYLGADREKRKTVSIRLQGLQPAFFDHTAWDLAQATQSLAYMDPELNLLLARIYNAQQSYEGLTRGMTQAMYFRPPALELDSFVAAVAIYYGDITLIEPSLLRQYDEVLPKIDQALGKRQR